MLQLEQKLRSEEQRSSFGVPRSLMAVYFLLVLVSEHKHGGLVPVGWDAVGEVLLDQLLALEDLQAIRDAAQVHAATIAADFAADAAGAELVGDWC